jgi:hypothetical protein
MDQEVGRDRAVGTAKATRVFFGIKDDQGKIISRQRMSTMKIDGFKKFRPNKFFMLLRMHAPGNSDRRVDLKDAEAMSRCFPRKTA